MFLKCLDPPEISSPDVQQKTESIIFRCKIWALSCLTTINAIKPMYVLELIHIRLDHTAEKQDPTAACISWVIQRLEIKTQKSIQQHIAPRNSPKIDPTTPTSDPTAIIARNQLALDNNLNKWHIQLCTTRWSCQEVRAYLRFASNNDHYGFSLTSSQFCDFNEQYLSSVRIYIML